jgi:hypothetical protein
MSEKVMKTNKEETAPKTLVVKKHQGRYSTEKNNTAPKLNVSETGPRQPRGKKQRRQFKLDPNRG